MRFKRLLLLTEAFLIEDTVKHLVPKFQKEVVGDRQWKDLTPEDQNKVKAHIEKRSKEIEAQVASASTNPQYQSWIYKNLKNGDLVFPEDVSKTKESLKQFENLKNLKDYEGSKKIEDYASQRALHAAVRGYLDKNKSSSGDHDVDAGGNPTVYEKGLYKAIELDDYNAALPLIEKTNWCVKHRNNWEEYKPPYYMVSYRNKPFALVHFPSQQLKDVDDAAFTSSKVDDDFFEVLNWLIENKNPVEDNVVNPPNSIQPLFGDFIPILINKMGLSYKKQAVASNFDSLLMIDGSNDDEIDALLTDLFQRQHATGDILAYASWRRGTEEEKKKFVSMNGNLIKFVDNPSEAIQRTAVDEDTRALKYIKNPTEKTMLDAVQNNPQVIADIPNPSEEVQLAAVRESPYYLKSIKNPTLRVKIKAVEMNPNYIGDIENPDKAVQMMAVSKNGRVLNLIVNPDDDVKRAAVESSPDSIIYVPDADENLQMMAVEAGAFYIAYIIHPTEKVARYALTADPYLISKIKPRSVSPELLEKLQILAVRSDPRVIGAILQPSHDVQLEAARLMMDKNPNISTWGFYFPNYKSVFSEDVIEQVQAEKGIGR